MDFDFLDKLRVDRQSEISHIEAGVVSLLDSDLKNIKEVNQIRIKLNKLNTLIECDYEIIKSYLKEAERICKRADKREKIARIKTQIAELQSELQELEV